MSLIGPVSLLGISIVDLKQILNIVLLLKCNSVHTAQKITVVNQD